MPRPAKGPRLWWSARDATWIILDTGGVFRRTGCGEGERASAEEKLGQYLLEKYQPPERENSLAKLSCAQVIDAYAREHAPHTRGQTRVTISYNIEALLPFWGPKMLTEVRGASCRAYAAQRGKRVGAATIRRELSVLSAAINHWHKEHGPLTSVPIVTMPEKPASRERWLTRSEAALLLAGALGFYRVMWSDVATRKVHVTWRRNRFAINRHVARFILLGLASGTRAGAIVALQWMPNTVGGWIDLQRSIMHRRGSAETESNKKRPPARLGRKILAHLRRWQAIDEEARDRAARELGGPVATHLHIVNYDGQPVTKVRRAWATARELAWLDDKVTPHVLRHTRATWLMQEGVPQFEAAGHLGMSAKTLDAVYAHQHPDFQKRAAEV